MSSSSRGLAPREGLGCLVDEDGSYGPFKTLARGQASRGAKPREADDGSPPQEWPSQAGSRGAEISRRGKPHEALVM